MTIIMVNEQEANPSLEGGASVETMHLGRSWFDYWSALSIYNGTY